MGIRLSDNALAGLARSGNKDAAKELEERDQQFTDWITAQTKIKIWATTEEDFAKVQAENHKLVAQGMTPYQATMHIAQFIQAILNPDRHSNDRDLPPRA